MYWNRTDGYSNKDGTCRRSAREGIRQGPDER